MWGGGVLNPISKLTTREIERKLDFFTVTENVSKLTEKITRYAGFVDRMNEKKKQFVVMNLYCKQYSPGLLLISEVFNDNVFK